MSRLVKVAENLEQQIAELQRERELIRDYLANPTKWVVGQHVVVFRYGNAHRSVVRHVDPNAWIQLERPYDDFRYAWDGKGMKNSPGHIELYATVEHALVLRVADTRDKLRRLAALPLTDDRILEHRIAIERLYDDLTA